MRASAEAGSGEVTDGGHLGEAAAGTDHVQHVLAAAGARLEHPHQSLPHHVHAGAGLVFAENHLSLAKMAQPPDRGQPLKAGRRDRGKQFTTGKDVDDVHGCGQNNAEDF